MRARETPRVEVGGVLQENNPGLQGLLAVFLDMLHGHPDGYKAGRFTVEVDVELQEGGEGTSVHVTTTNVTSFEGIAPRPKLRLLP